MPNGQWRGSARRDQLPVNWRQLCTDVRQTYGSSCYLCGHHNASDTDHVVPGNDHSLSNLRPICGTRCSECGAEHRAPCHVAKSSREGGQAAQAARPKRARAPEQHPGMVN
jgi:5-methylcytosine-specific restriction protein A